MYSRALFREAQTDEITDKEKTTESTALTL